MKKYQYIVAAACILVGVVGFASIYAIDQSQKEKQEQVGKNTETEKPDTESEEPNVDDSQVAENTPSESEEPNVSEEPEEPKEPETPVENVQPEVLHFTPEKGLVRPVEGPILLEYSMDATIYYPTLEQYQYSPALVLGGKVNDKVYLVARGKITNISTNEETGCTVTQDLGDGYTAVYGQLKELNFKVGDMVEAGQVIGYIGEPTKYYSVEGPNVYFQMLKNGKPINPKDFFEE